MKMSKEGALALFEAIYDFNRKDFRRSRNALIETYGRILSSEEFWELEKEHPSNSHVRIIHRMYFETVNFLVKDPYGVMKENMTFDEAEKVLTKWNREIERREYEEKREKLLNAGKSTGKLDRDYESRMKRLLLA